MRSITLHENHRADTQGRADTREWLGGKYYLQSAFKHLSIFFIETYQNRSKFHEAKVGVIFLTECSVEHTFSMSLSCWHDYDVVL